jgi:hypothetical protein
MLPSLPVKGFLGTGAPFEADVNLVAQVVMGAALVTGFFSCKTKTLQSPRHLPNDGVAPELVDDRTSDVARVPATSESNNSQGPS